MAHSVLGERGVEGNWECGRRNKKGMRSTGEGKKERFGDEEIGRRDGPGVYD